MVTIRLWFTVECWVALSDHIAIHDFDYGML